MKPRETTFDVYLSCAFDYNEDNHLSRGYLMAVIFITGGAGFIGSNFVRYWLDNNPEDYVINYDLLTYAGNINNLSGLDQRKKQNYKFVRADIANYEFLRYLFELYKPEWIVNFAAETHNSRAVLDPQIFFRTNVLGTQQLLQAALDAGVPRFHHISTCEVYGDLSLDSKDRFHERSPYRPRTPYNASKASADMVVRAYFETFGLPITISICSNNYGANQFPEKLIPYFTIRLINDQKMPLYRSSFNRREWLHVNDHCRAIDTILKKGQVGETYNVGSGYEVDVETIADMLLDEFGMDSTYKEYVADRPGHDRRYLLDSTKIQRELGWEPRIPFKQGFYDTVRWYKQNEDWWRPLLQKLRVDEGAWSSG
jgi:dTDP-glucose 4,6-dehydratase